MFYYYTGETSLWLSLSSLTRAPLKTFCARMRIVTCPSVFLSVFLSLCMPVRWKVLNTAYAMRYHTTVSLHQCNYSATLNLILFKNLHIICITNLWFVINTTSPPPFQPPTIPITVHTLLNIGPSCDTESTRVLLSVKHYYRFNLSIYIYTHI